MEKAAFSPKLFGEDHTAGLLDEIEKAHKDVTELFYQVFDKGMIEDGEGRQIDC